jgi:hypothetical protein
MEIGPENTGLNQKMEGRNASQGGKEIEREDKVFGKLCLPTPRSKEQVP